MNMQQIIIKNGWEIEKNSLEEIEAKWTKGSSDMGVFWD
jgi:hypothetical protein